MVYSTRRFVVCLSVCHFVLVFFSPFSIAITSFGEKRAILSAFSYICSVSACLDLSVSSSSWGLGRAAVCDCGTPWAFLLPFYKALLQLANFTVGPDATLYTEIHKNSVHIKAPYSVNAPNRKYKNQINHYVKQRRVLMAILLCSRVKENQ